MSLADPQSSPSAEHAGLLFVTILISLFSLAPGLAHLFELPRKMMLEREDYFTVQQIYSGWALFGYVLAAQFIALVMLAWAWHRQPEFLRAALTALSLLIAAQILFWTFTFPANTATRNWTEIPANWEALRRNWEFSHAAGALCQFGGLVYLIRASLRGG